MTTTDQGDVLDIRALTTPAEEARVKQAINDLTRQVSEAKDRMDIEAARLEYLECTAHAALNMVLRSDAIQRLSVARAKWCKAMTALDDANFAFDRIMYLRAVYIEGLDGTP